MRDVHVEVHSANCHFHFETVRAQKWGERNFDGHHVIVGRPHAVNLMKALYAEGLCVAVSVDDLQTIEQLLRPTPATGSMAAANVKHPNGERSRVPIVEPNQVELRAIRAATLILGLAWIEGRLASDLISILALGAWPGAAHLIATSTLAVAIRVLR